MHRLATTLSTALALLTALAPPTRAQENHAAATLFVRAVEGRFEAAVEIELDSGWHIYHDDLGPEDAVGEPTVLTFGGAEVEWQRPVFPEPHVYPQPFGKRGKPTWINGHEEFLTVYAVGTPAAGATPDAVTVSISGLTCTEEFCLPYGESDLASSGAGSESVWRDFPVAALGRGVGADPGSEPAPGGASEDSTPVAAAGGGGTGSGNAPRPEPAELNTGPGAAGGMTPQVPPEKPLLLFLLAAMGGGIFALLMPCTYPMIPITISFFTKQAEQKHGNQLLLSLVYGLGIVAIFILIGVAFSGVIIPFATHPVTNLVIGVVFVFFALALFGWITLQPPAFLMQAAGKASMRGGVIGVFLMGATLVVTSFTCTAPFVGSLLAAGASGGMARIVLGMTVFGLTMAVPFVALSMVPRKLATMPKAGEWMHVLKVFMGFVELAAALKFISNADIQWGWGLLPRELFLVLWAGIFAVAAAFLFGLIHVKGERHEGIGPGRLVGATATFLFALYCWYALENKPVGFMTAIVPNYSMPLRAGGGGGNEAAESGDHLIVKDDYDAARELAAQKGLALLVNFTGHT